MCRWGVQCVCLSACMHMYVCVCQQAYERVLPACMHMYVCVCEQAYERVYSGECVPAHSVTTAYMYMHISEYMCMIMNMQ